MRVLTLHAFYRTQGGEDVSHRSEVQYLREAGHEVHDLTVSNVDFAKRSTAMQAIDMAYSAAAFSSVESAIRAFRPELMYVNNTFPALSPSVFRAAGKANLPSVQVLRNYRHFCVSGGAYRDGAECTSCLSKEFGLKGIQCRCYRGSLTQSIGATVSRAVARSIHRAGYPSHYIAVSNYVRDLMVRDDIAAEQISVRPNLILPTGDDPGPVPRERSVMYVGRGTAEKGLPWLIDQFRRVADDASKLNIVGVRAGEVHAPADPRVHFHGAVDSEAARRMMGSARCVVVPSLWPEPFGRVVVEAMAAGTPVIASAVGGMRDFAGPGVSLVDPGEPNSLGREIANHLCMSASAQSTLREDVLSRYEREFSARQWLSNTQSIFESLVHGR